MPRCGGHVLINGWLGRIRDDQTRCVVAFGDVRPMLHASGDPRTIVLEEGTPVSDQLSVPACVANSICDAIEIRAHNMGRPVRQLSRMFAHFAARFRDGTSGDPETGTYTTSAIEAMREVGICSEETYPYSEGPTERPYAAAYVEASANRLTGFRMIDSLGAVDTALAQHYPVLLAARIRADFRAAGATYIPSGVGPTIGGHMVLIVGVRYVDGRRQYLIRNSWGEGWGASGHTWADEVFVQTAWDLAVVSCDGATSLWDDVS